MLINYVREQVDLGIIKILKIPGQNNMSDVLTKPNFNEKVFEKDGRPPWKASSGSLIVNLYISST